MGLEEDNQNFLLMYSISVNVSGQIASVIAGGLILTLMAEGGAVMIYLSSWMTTLPIMIIGMVGIILVIGIIVLAVMLLNSFY